MDGEPFIVDAATGVVTAPQQETELLSESKPAVATSKPVRSIVVNAHAIRNLINRLSTTQQTPPVIIVPQSKQVIGQILASLPNVHSDILPYAGTNKCDTPVIVQAEEETTEPRDTRPQPLL